MSVCRPGASALIIMVLAACAAGGDAGSPSAARDAALVRVDHPDLEPDRTNRSLRPTPATGSLWEVVELVGPGMLGVVVVSRMAPGQRVVDRPTEGWVRSIIGPDYRIAWGAEGRADPASGLPGYRLFRMGDERGAVFACVGFSERTSADGADVVFGYFCRERDQALELSDAEELVAAVDVGPSAGTGPPADVLSHLATTDA